MKKISLFVLLSVACAAVCAQDTVWMSLDSCVRYANSHNISVLSAEMGRQQAALRVESAKMNFTPSLSASASESMSLREGTSSMNTNLGVNASVTLFNGLSNLNNYRQSQLSLQQNDLKVRQSENSVAKEIIQSFLTIRMNEERLSYQQEVLATTEQQKLEGELKYQVGKILESDYLLLVANYQNAVNEIENIRLTIEQNRLALKSLLCMNDNSVIGVVADDEGAKSTDFVLPELETVMRVAFDTLPDLKISKMNVEMAEYDVKIARAAYSPTLALSAGTNYNGGSDLISSSGAMLQGGVNSSAALSLSIPILNRGNNRTQVKQSKIQLQEAQLQHEQSTIDLRKQIENHYYSTQQALNQYRSSELLEEAYKANYDVYVLKFGEGAVTTVEMLQQQDRYLSALNDFLQNKYNFMLDLEVLEIYQGK